jgi:hypothetical protein
MIVGFYLLFGAVLVTRARTEIRLRRARALRARADARGPAGPAEGAAA